LEQIHSDFEGWLNHYPPDNIDTLQPVGYTGYRWVTEIQYVWNAYFLALTIPVAENAEQKRLADSEKSVFSYRFGFDAATGKLFKDSTWLDYKRRALELSKEFGYALVTDVSDFYPRIYHHRLENELKRLDLQNDLPFRILKLLTHFSKTVSYGLPVGGPASRILAEIALHPVDLHLNRAGIPFCRYTDDFHLFARTKEDAYRILSFLSDKLFNEGLSLQKSKTRIVTAKELQESSQYLDPIAAGAEITPESRLLGLSIRFDPYSPTADEEYETLKQAVRSIDIAKILAREIGKTAVDPLVTRQAIRAIRALPDDIRDKAIATLIDPENIQILAPAFITILRLLRQIYNDLGGHVSGRVDAFLVELLESRSHLLTNDLNLAYLLQVLGKDKTLRKEQILIQLFNERASPLIRRLIILIMAHWRAYAVWILDVLGAKRVHRRVLLLRRRRLALARALQECIQSHGDSHPRLVFTTAARNR
jgi:Reverse transcriptase (RNA-dependent DNA polymerase)